MNIVVVSGSSRPGSQSIKISSWAESKLQALGISASVIDLHTLPLPLNVDLDVAALKEAPEALKAWEPVRGQLIEADGFVIVSPEWNGMAPPALLNFMLYVSADEHKPFAHKPVQLITVSGTKYGGNYPVAELRAFGMKNSHGVYVPDHVTIRQAKTVFNASSPEDGNEYDAYLQKRAEYSLAMLLQYAEALKTMRGQSKIRLVAYPNGM